jgi:hypothetical protein
LPNAPLPGILHHKPLNAAIWQLLTLYCPGGRQGNNQHNDYEKCTHFAGRVDGHCFAPVLFHAHCLMEEVCGFHKSH